MTSPASRLVASIYAAAAESQSAGPSERAAAVRIQSAVRMHQQRQRFVFIRRCAVNVQRVFRGYRGRVRVLDFQIALARLRQHRLFHCHARNIQRVFRGFLCRKYTSDVCALKAYIARITETSESVRLGAVQARRDQEEYLAREQAVTMRRDFDDAIRNKHHLLSTAVLAGVLRTPLAPGGTRTVFGSDIEDEIRAMPIERPKRSKFLRDVIPVTDNAAANANTKKAATSRGQPPAAVSASGKSSGGVTGSSTGQQKRLNFSAPKQPYQRSLHSESEYESSDGGVGRLVEEQVVAGMHPGTRGGYFHVPARTDRGPQTASGYTGTKK
jgi:hypothetical protein